ncbi:MAG: glycoside hydrolase family 3 N-terminal domain-containing protein [Bacteroidales bacterium]
MKKLSFLFLLIFSFIHFTQAQDENPDFRWLDPTLSVEERSAALIGAMTLEEKYTQLMDQAPAIPRLDVPEYGWWNECLHGVARNGRATVFPQAIALGATFDEDLIFRVSTAISDEARAKFNVAIAHDNRSKYAGLTFWSPNVNLFRDPRWGRGQETYGEDPYLTSRIGVAFVKGIQGNHPTYLKAAACAKHYVVHSGPEALRHEFDAVVSPRDLWETYMPAFQALVTEAKVEGVMGAYNRTNGESCSASEYLMKEVLRNQWKFDGYFVSDCGAINDIWQHHKLTDTPESAAALSIKAGMNLNCGSNFNFLGKAVDEGLLTEEDIDEALIQLTKTKFRLGFFDPVEENPYSRLGAEVVGSDAHVALAREVAQKSIVLVKNNNVLPLKKEIKTLFVTGPMAANADVLMGNYYGISGNTVNFLDGLAGHVSVGTTIEYKYGQMPYRENDNPIDWTTGGAAAADACIAIMGINGLWEGEEGESIASFNKGDNTDCRLPKGQVDFLKKIRSQGDNPLIVVITGGSPVIIPEVFEFADAVIYTWYPGEQGGNALADLIFGDASPSGRMPFTVPYSVDDLPPYEDYAMAGRTYRYMETDPLFTFGFGLSYTTFRYSGITAEKVEDKMLIRAKVTNTGDHAGEEVSQLYIASPLAGKGYPLYSLRGLQRKLIPAGESVMIDFELPAEALMQVDETGGKFLPKGDYKIFVAGAVPSERSQVLGAAEPVELVLDWKTVRKL